MGVTHVPKIYAKSIMTHTMYWMPFALKNVVLFALIISIVHLLLKNAIIEKEHSRRRNKSKTDQTNFVGKPVSKRMRRQEDDDEDEGEDEDEVEDEDEDEDEDEGEDEDEDTRTGKSKSKSKSMDMIMNMNMNMSDEEGSSKQRAVKKDVSLTENQKAPRKKNKGATRNGTDIDDEDELYSYVFSGSNSEEAVRDQQPSKPTLPYQQQLPKQSQVTILPEAHTLHQTQHQQWAPYQGVSRDSADALTGVQNTETSMNGSAAVMNGLQCANVFGEDFSEFNPHAASSSSSSSPSSANCQNERQVASHNGSGIGIGRGSRVGSLNGALV